MERHEEGDTHSARPEQTGDDSGFAEGLDHSPDPPEEELAPNFARGISREDAPGVQRQPRFSEGNEESPRSRDNNAERRFSEGREKTPTDD